jgi:hypothetical protein
MRCEERNPQPLEGLCQQKIDRLGRRDRNKVKEQRWRAIYEICFPDEHIPSPCELGLSTVLYTSSFQLLYCFTTKSHRLFQLTPYLDHIYPPPRAPPQLQDILAIVRETLPVNDPHRGFLLQRLEDAYTRSPRGPISSLPHTLSIPSMSDTFTSPAAVSNNGQPPIQRFETPHGISQVEHGNQNYSFIADDAPAEVMNVGGYNPYPDINWDFANGSNSGSGFGNQFMG